MAISIALCGLVRDRDVLSAKLVQWQQWRREGLVRKIVYATWIGELDKYPGLRDELETAAVDLVEVVEPKLILKHGHQLHQMTAFHFALSALENEDEFIYKTRVDLSNYDANMTALFRDGTLASDDFLKLGFKNRIVVDYAQMIYPFLCGDAQFLGRKRDLVRLVNLSNEMEILFQRLAVEQTFFFQPFRHIALFRTHFYWNQPYVGEVTRNRAGMVKALLRTPEMHDALKAWWMILGGYFQVGWGKRLPYPQVTTFEQALAFHQEGTKVIGFNLTDMISNDAFVAALNDVIGPEERSRLLSTMETATDKPLAIPPQTFKAYEGFRLSLSDLPPPRAVAAGSEKKIELHDQQFFLKATDPNVYDYQAELVQLRREIHRVNELLRGNGSLEFRNLLHKWLQQLLPRRVVRFVRDRLPAFTDYYRRYLAGEKTKP